MTPKQRRFVQEYLLDLNATQAAIRAGYSRRTARAIGSENLTKPDVVAAIERAQAERSARTELTQDRLLQELGAIAFADVRDLFDAEGNVRPIQLLAASSAAIVSGLEVVEAPGSGERRLKVRLYDKLRALDLLGRHLGTWRERPNGTDADDPIVVQVVRFGEGETNQPQEGQDPDTGRAEPASDSNTDRGSSQHGTPTPTG